MMDVMTEFGSTWPGWQFDTKLTDLADVMADPDGGIALVELRSKTRELSLDLAAAASNLARIHSGVKYRTQLLPEDRERTRYAFPDAIINDFPYFKKPVLSLIDELNDVVAPTLEDFCIPNHGMSLQMITGFRHASNSNGHIDGFYVSGWLGANKPGYFIIGKNGEQIPIDSLPENHVLFMRGGDHPELEGIRHGVTYRSAKIPRTVLLCHDWSPNPFINIPSQEK